MAETAVAQAPEQAKEAARTKPVATPVDFSAAEKVWNIYGTGFGETPGEVTLNGERLEVFRWADRRIKGVVPSGGLKHGAVMVLTPDGATFSAHYGAKMANKER